jgi:ribonucleoside-diphosphate reductase beta chain
MTLPSLITESVGYKPHRYPWAFDAWKKQQQVHWMPEEVPMADDIRDWSFRLAPKEQNLLAHIFRFFTEGDVEVANCYHTHYLPVFKPTEVKMMLTAFANMETIHIAAYALLLESVGMPEVEFNAFMKYKAMKDKHDYMRDFRSDDPYQMALTLAAFGAFTEGLQLFASFAMLMNFPRFNKMKGMGQIVTWSVRDETMHTNNLIRLHHTWVSENAAVIDRARLTADLTRICLEIVSHEDAFIDLAFELGDVEGMTSDDIKTYIRFIANLRCRQLSIPEPFPAITANPLPWLDDLLSGREHANFFEARATEYSKAATTGAMNDGDW